MKRELLYEGKAKRVYSTQDPLLLVIEFKDSLTAFDGKKRAELKGKGVLNCKISSRLFKFLKDKEIENHFVKTLTEREMVVDRLDMIKIEAVVRNWAAGHILKRLGIEQGEKFKSPILEFYYKRDDLGDPMINLSHIRELELATYEEMDRISELSLRVNQELSGFFRDRGIRLIDFKLEFGRKEGKILLGDEISPDTCRLWDMETGKVLDKDRFRRDMGEVLEAYKEIWERIRE